MRTSSTFSSALFCIAFVFGLPQATSGQNCACGFKDSNNHIWRESIISTFSQDAGALAAVNANWRAASDNGVLTHTGYTMQYTTANVLQYNDALGLQTSAYAGGAIMTAEIDTQRDDIQYGTFRMRAQVPRVPGVVFGFFTYQGDSQEQDIEFLSSDPNYAQTVHYTNQPSLVNGDVDPNASKTVILPNPADFTAFSDHRLDWLPGQTTFYYNNALTSTITKNVPTMGSHVILNVWSNGDPQFSKGPPTQNAIATIQNVQLYFNSTGFKEPAFNAACANARNPPVCLI